MLDRLRLALEESFAQKGMKFVNSERTNSPQPNSPLLVFLGQSLIKPLSAGLSRIPVIQGALVQTGGLGRDLS